MSRSNALKPEYTENSLAKYACNAEKEFVPDLSHNYFIPKELCH